MSQATELIAQQLGSAISSQRTWGSIIFNVKDPQYGAKGDGVTDDSSKVQSAINATIAAGAKLVFFPPGTYKVTALTNANSVYFVGDNANITGADYPIYSWGKNLSDQLRNADRFRNYLRVTSVEDALVFVGDSITEGAKSVDYANNGYPAIIRKAIATEYSNKNYGFESFYVGSGTTKSHGVTLSGFSVAFDGNYYGGVKASATTTGAYIDVQFTGKDFKLVYGGRADGGILNVIVDSVTLGTINTATIGSVPNATISAKFSAPTWGQHTIRLQKADIQPVDMCGLMYYEDASVNSPTVHNVGRSDLTMFEIPNNILDAYVGNGMVVLALGVNDQLFSKDITVFENKVDYVASKIRANKGNLIICDFMFSLPYSNPYKKVLRTVANNYPEFELIDFGRLWFSDASTNISAGLLNTDGVHPTIAGHEYIANVLLKHMNLPYTKKSVPFVPDAAFVPLTLQNSWINFGAAYETPAYRLYPNGIVKLRGTIKSGVTTVNTILATLPVGRRPLKDRLYNGANTAYCEIGISAANGNIFINTAALATYLSLDSISFEID